MGLTTFSFAALAHITLSHKPMGMNVAHLEDSAFMEVNRNCILKNSYFYFFCGEASYIITFQPVLVQ